MKVPPCFRDREASRQISDLCRENNIDVSLLQDLCEVLGEYAGAGRKEGIVSDISECIDRFLARCP